MGDVMTEGSKEKGRWWREALKDGCWFRLGHGGERWSKVGEETEWPQERKI